MTELITIKNLKLEPEQKSILDNVHRFIKREVNPFILKWEEEYNRLKSHQQIIPELKEKYSAFLPKLYRQFWEMGMMNLSIPENYGGLPGLNASLNALIVEEISRGCSGLGTSIMCNDLANVVFSLFANDEQMIKYLVPFAEDFKISSFCLTEPNAGSDNSSMKTNIKQLTGSTWTINGSKCFITNASFASQFTVVCQYIDPEINESTGLAVVIIPAFNESGEPIKGIEIGKVEDKLGQRLSNTAVVNFEDVVFDESQIIMFTDEDGDLLPDNGFSIVEGILTYARPIVGSIGIGVAQKSLDLAVDYAKERVQFKKCIYDIKEVRNMLIKMERAVKNARSKILSCTLLLDEVSALDKQDKSDRRDVEISKLYLKTFPFKKDLKEPTADNSSEMLEELNLMVQLLASQGKNMGAHAGTFNAATGLQIHGGYGFMNEYEISKLDRDSKIVPIYEGTTQIQNILIERTFDKLGFPKELRNNWEKDLFTVLPSEEAEIIEVK